MRRVGKAVARDAAEGHTVELGHEPVEQDDPGAFALFEHAQSLGTGRGLAYVGRQIGDQSPQTSSHQRLIVNDENRSHSTSGALLAIIQNGTAGKFFRVNLISVNDGPAVVERRVGSSALSLHPDVAPRRTARRAPRHQRKRRCRSP
jgi:hypothetical protein